MFLTCYTLRLNLYPFIVDGLVIVNFPRHLDAIVGRNLTIVCEVALETKSVVTFKWSQNLQPLTERNIKITNTERRSVLFINSLTKKNSAVYICEAIADGLATAGRSKDIADIRIQVEGKKMSVNLNGKRCPCPCNLFFAPRPSGAPDLDQCECSSKASRQHNVENT